MNWNPQGSRRCRHPSNTWRRIIISVLNQCNLTLENAKTAAGKRGRWRCQMEALCSLAE